MSFQTAVVIDKNGEKQTIPIPRNISENNFHMLLTNKGDLNSFDLLCIWEDFEDSLICLYGFANGRENIINKHELPEPMESDLCYGDLLIVRMNMEEELSSLDVSGYERFYNWIFEGFEDVGEESSYSDCGDYVYDDFCVDDDTFN